MALNQVTTELFYNGVWNDVSSDVRVNPGHRMKWGRSDEGSQPQPSTCELVFDNTDLTYTPRNPTSALYGLVGRNTPVRVRIGPKDPRLSLPGGEESYASTPDDASLDITGDLDIRMECEPVTWRPDGFLGFARKYETSGDQRSWGWWLTSSGELRVRWSPDGTFGSAITVTSTAAIPDASGRIAIRVTVDVDNAASGNDVTFYTADSLADLGGGPSESQLGATVTTSGVTAIFASTVPLDVGSVSRPGAIGVVGDAPFEGDVFAFELYDGIDGTAVADPDFTDLEAGDVAFTDAAGRDWTLHGGASITDPSVRFMGEISSWNPVADLSDTDRRVPVTASGLRRRLGQGEKAFRSSLYRALSTDDNVVAYWPMEEPKGATTFASPIGPERMSIHPTSGPTLADYSDSPASDPLPTFHDDDLQSRSLSFPGYTPAANFRWTVFLHLPEDGIPSPISISETFTTVRFSTGSAYMWIIGTTSAGGLRLRCFDRDFVEILDDGPGAHDLNGRNAFVWVWLSQNGADIDWQYGSLKQGDTVGLATSGTLSGHTFGAVESVEVGNPIGRDLAGAAMGHAFALNDDVHTGFWNAASKALTSYRGEPSPARVARLADETGVPVTINDTSNPGSTGMGFQTSQTFLELIDEAALVDQAIVADRRDDIRLLWRSGRTLYNQTPKIVLDWDAGDVAATLEPVEDDQLVRNDVTVKRLGGSEARSVDTTSAMSVSSIGRYDVDLTRNVAFDGQLTDQAGWLLHLGTINEPRFPRISVDLTARPDLAADAMSVYVGDRIQIINAPGWMPPGVIDQIVQGGEERITPSRHTITWNCSPATQVTVAEVSGATPGPDEPVRVDTDGSQIQGVAMLEETTTMVVGTDAGFPLWTVDAAEFPFDVVVGGEVMRVTGITGTTSPQEFTVTRSINGVVKEHSVGADVRLNTPAIVAIGG